MVMYLNFKNKVLWLGIYKKKLKKLETFFFNKL